MLSNRPTRFGHFWRVNDASPLWTTYEFEAKANATTSNLVGPFDDVAYQVVLPGSVTSSNAHYKEQGVPTWNLREGQVLEMKARSRVSKLGVGSIGTWILGGVGILALALIAVVWYTGLCQDAGKQPLLARIATKNRISTTVTITAVSIPRPALKTFGPSMRILTAREPLTICTAIPQTAMKAFHNRLVSGL